MTFNFFGVGYREVGKESVGDILLLYLEIVRLPKNGPSRPDHTSLGDEELIFNRMIVYFIRLYGPRVRLGRRVRRQKFLVDSMLKAGRLVQPERLHRRHVEALCGSIGRLERQRKR
jgi:hypothetical protein